VRLPQARQAVCRNIFGCGVAECFGYACEGVATRWWASGFHAPILDWQREPQESVCNGAEIGSQGLVSHKGAKKWSQYVFHGARREQTFGLARKNTPHRTARTSEASLFDTLLSFLCTT
jgi:hypothetical protein